MCRSSIRLRMSRGTSSERAVPTMRRRIRCGPGSDPISPQSGRIAAVSARPDADPSLAASKKPYRNRARPKQHRKLLRPACWAGYFRGSQRPLDCGLAERYGRACSYPERRMRDREEANLEFNRKSCPSLHSRTTGPRSALARQTVGSKAGISRSRDKHGGAVEEAST